MDCLRIMYAPINNTTRRYLGVYHHRRADLKSFEIHLAQSFDLLHWETLRRLVANADMPVVSMDARSGKVVLVYENYLSPRSNWPSAIGFRLYDSVQQLLLGKAAKMFTAPNTVSRLEGTPNVYSFDAARGTVEVGFHYQNETLLRDEVGRATLTQFPEAPVWEAAPDRHYTGTMTRAGSSGNVGGRDVVEFGGARHVVCEGNTQPPPFHPTRFADWRVWLWDGNATVRASRRAPHPTQSQTPPDRFGWHEWR